MRHLTAIIASLVVVVAEQAIASPDVIHLRGGVTIEGTITVESDSLVVIETTSGDSRCVKRENITAIDRERKPGDSATTRSSVTRTAAPAQPPQDAAAIRREKDTRDAMRTANAIAHSRRGILGTYLPIREAGVVGMSAQIAELDADTTKYLDCSIDDVVRRYSRALRGTDDRYAMLRDMAGVLCWTEGEVVEIRQSATSGTTITTRFRSTFFVGTDTRDLLDDQSAKVGDLVRFPCALTLTQDGGNAFLSSDRDFANPFRGIVLGPPLHSDKPKPR